MTAWTDALVVKYGDAIDSMERALRSCPDELWSASMWTVRDVPAVRAGMGADLVRVWEHATQIHMFVDGRSPAGTSP